jgi:RHS repeat-associated protein
MGAWLCLAGGQLVATQFRNAVYWTHQDPINKSQRLTDMWGNVVAGIELDPWGGETNRSWNTFYQPHRYTSWERGWTGDQSLFRRYHGWFSRFAHPDPSDGSYNSTDPQSFNRYAYVQNDPVNFVDPSGLNLSNGGIGGGGYCWFTSELINDRWTLVGVHCMDTGGGGGPIEPGGVGGGGGDPQEPRDQQKINPSNQRVEECVARVLARYLGHEALTLLKQTALGAGIGLSVLAGNFFIGHAVGGTIAAGTLTEIGVALGIRMDHLARGIAFLGGAIWAGVKLYPKFVKESFNSKKEAVRDLKACYP